MHLKSLAAVAALVALANPAFAQLEVYKDYTVSDAVWEVTTVKVDANMGDYYLEGIRSTWVASNEVAKSLGHIEDYSIMTSVMPSSGDFNMVLSVRYANMAEYAPSKAKYDAFMASWGKANADASQETAKTYPELRELTGQYLMQKVEILPKKK